MLRLKLQYFGDLMRRTDSLEKTLMLGKIEGTTEDEMVGWHHWLDGHEVEQAPGVGVRPGSLACCSPWGRRVGHDWATELNWSPLGREHWPLPTAGPSCQSRNSPIQTPDSWSEVLCIISWGTHRIGVCDQPVTSLLFPFKLWAKSLSTANSFEQSKHPHHLFFNFLATQNCLWYLRSLTRDRTWALGS